MLAGLDDRGVSYLLFQDVWGGNEMDKREGTLVCVEKAGSDNS
jgi:hypothetical protein